ncbi:MAG: class II aldolase/adducin family protein [Thermodesulfovibrionales bacterium]|nr:class II aldolase/adducin family protein [Thermodesulfovibrionales bacterium]
MKRLIEKYLKKLEQQGLVNPKETVFIASDDRVYSNTRLSKSLVTIFDEMNINSLIIAKPVEPYKKIIESLVVSKDKVIIPQDCETRTFFHDFPVIEKVNKQSIIQALSKRKSAVSRDGRVVAYGMVSPEQAYINISSTFFSLFVKYFVDRINLKEAIPKAIYNLIKEIQPLNLKEGSIFEAGKALVSLRLVDSYFGNISFINDGLIHISQTGSSLDELEDTIVTVPLDMSSTNGIIASSEFSTHRSVYLNTDFRYIIHGHPPFTVIQSMLCDERDCVRGDMCYQSCKKERYFAGIPIVSGEIGTGTNALVNTVPNAMKQSNAVIVYGHGIFVASKEGFQQCLDEIIRIENTALMDILRTKRS